jgi:myo-inositol-1(or 4)-monophosphatase
MDTISLTALQEFEAFAQRLADEAKAISLSYFRSTLTIETKADESPVTVADQTIEAHVRARINAAYPTHGIFGEEHGRERLDAEFVWVIDPIDGTRSFITGWPLWGTLFALLHNGEPILGMIDMPVLGERWVGSRLGARSQTGQVVKTSACTALAAASVYATSPDIFDTNEKAVFERVSLAAKSRRFGGDCYSYAVLASGHIDAVVEAGLQPYDYLAIVPVVEAAGGVVTDWKGHKVSVDSGGRIIAAATPALHREILAMTSVL